MQSQQLQRRQRMPTRRAHDEFIRGVVASVILGSAAWPVIIFGVLFLVR